MKVQSRYQVAVGLVALSRRMVTGWAVLALDFRHPADSVRPVDLAAAAVDFVPHPGPAAVGFLAPAVVAAVAAVVAVEAFARLIPGYVWRPHHRASSVKLLCKLLSPPPNPAS